MAAIEKCSRCYEPLGEGIRRGIVIEYYPEDPVNPPLRTMPRMLCKECTIELNMFLSGYVLNPMVMCGDRKEAKE